LVGEEEARIVHLDANYSSRANVGYVEGMSDQFALSVGDCKEVVGRAWGVMLLMFSSSHPSDKAEGWPRPTLG
jgi:hypothetical protein